MSTFVNEQGVVGYLHEPDHPSGRGVVLTHGAGGNAKAPLLEAVAEAFRATGAWVLRCDLAFRQRRAFGPPSPATAAADRASLAAALALLRQYTAGPFVLSGHSYGGRQATMLAEEQPAIADCLLLLSYPLHPPNRPERLRTEHFPTLRTPSVFVSGTKDPFGSPEELRAALKRIAGAAELILIEGAGHDLARGKFDMTKVVGAVA